MNYCLGVLLVVAIPALLGFLRCFVFLINVTCLLVDDEIRLAPNKQLVSCTLHFEPRTCSLSSVFQKYVVSPLNIGHQ